jgi:hypothetical protein
MTHRSGSKRPIGGKVCLNKRFRTNVIQILGYPPGRGHSKATSVVNVFLRHLCVGGATVVARQMAGLEPAEKKPIVVIARNQIRVGLASKE